MSISCLSRVKFARRLSLLLNVDLNFRLLLWTAKNWVWGGGWGAPHGPGGFDLDHVSGWDNWVCLGSVFCPLGTLLLPEYRDGELSVEKWGSSHDWAISVLGTMDPCMMWVVVGCGLFLFFFRMWFKSVRKWSETTFLCVCLGFFFPCTSENSSSMVNLLYWGI